MAASSLLKLETATLKDSSALVDLWFAAFSDPDSRRLFPYTPGVRKWFEDAIRYDLLRRPFQRYVKIVDSGAKDDNGQPRIAAYAKWDLSTAEQRGPRYPPWHNDMPADLCEALVSRGENNRKRVMGEQNHVCMLSVLFLRRIFVLTISRTKVLDIVATHPDYQRQGAASMLVKWGCDLADIERVSTYVSASKKGASLYTKFDFLDRSTAGQDTISMSRQSRPRFQASNNV